MQRARKLPPQQSLIGWQRSLLCFLANGRACPMLLIVVRSRPFLILTHVPTHLLTNIYWVWNYFCNVGLTKLHLFRLTEVGQCLTFKVETSIMPLVAPFVPLTCFGSACSPAPTGRYLHCTFSLGKTKTEDHPQHCRFLIRFRCTFTSFGDICRLHWHKTTCIDNDPWQCFAKDSKRLSEVCNIEIRSKTSTSMPFNHNDFSIYYCGLYIMNIIHDGHNSRASMSQNQPVFDIWYESTNNCFSLFSLSIGKSSRCPEKVPLSS